MTGDKAWLALTFLRFPIHPRGVGCGSGQGSNHRLFFSSTVILKQEEAIPLPLGYPARKKKEKKKSHQSLFTGVGEK